MRRCYIHTGHAKTATSYLQYCLHLNPEIFAEAGYWLPAEFAPFGFQDMAEVAATGGVMCGNLAPMHALMCEGPGEMVDPMFAYLLTPPGGRESADVILSSELFFYYVFATARVVNNARRRGFLPEIIVYLPRQDHGAISAFLQSVRYHHTSPGVVEFLVHDDFIPYCQYYRTLAKLRAAVPEIVIRVRTFAPAFLRDGDILSDFLAQIGGRVRAADLRRPDERSNQGLLLEHYEALRAAKILGQDAAAAAVRDLRVELTREDRARVRAFYYRPYVRRYLAAHFLPANEALLASFMPGADATEQEYWRTLDETEAAPVVDYGMINGLLRMRP